MMIDIIMDGDQCWPDLDLATLVEARVVALARLPGAMASGASSVSIRLALLDGRPVVAQLSLASLRAAVAAMVAADNLPIYKPAPDLDPPAPGWVQE